jgi:hypothetical protein
MPPAVEPQIATAAYAMIVTAVDAEGGHTVATHVSVSVLGDDDLIIHVRVRRDDDALPPPDFTDVGDRIGAVGGKLTVKPDTGGYSALAVIPSGKRLPMT